MILREGRSDRRIEQATLTARDNLWHVLQRLAQLAIRTNDAQATRSLADLARNRTLGAHSKVYIDPPAVAFVSRWCFFWGSE